MRQLAQMGYPEFDVENPALRVTVPSSLGHRAGFRVEGVLLYYLPRTGMLMRHHPSGLGRLKKEHFLCRACGR